METNYRFRTVLRQVIGGCGNAFAIAMLSLYPLLLVNSSLWGSAQGIQAEAHANQGLDLARAGNLAAAETELRVALELAPNDSSVLSNLGTILAMEKKFEESTSVFKRALELEPNNLTVRRYLAANLWQLHRYHEAKQNLEIILKQRPSEQPAVLLLGMVSENLKDYAAAAKLLAAVPDLVREQPESIAALTRSYYHIGQREKARATLDQLLTNPAGAPGVLLGAQIADEMRDYDAAEKLLVSSKSMFPDQSSWGLSLALVQFHAKRFDDSQGTLLNLISLGYKSSNIYNLLGWCYQEQHQPAQAVAALEQSISLDPAQESNYLDLGKMLVANRSLPAALDLAKRTTRAFPNSSRTFLFQGSVELKMAQFTDAIGSYAQAIQLESTDPDAKLGLAEAQFAAGMTKDATASFEEGMKGFPKDARFPLHYALMLLREAETGNTLAEAHAEELLKSALVLDHSLSEAHYQLGELALKKGQTGEALTHLQRAANLDQSSAEAHFALSRVYRRLGRKEEATRQMDLYQKVKEAESPVTPTSQPDGLSRN